MSSAGEFFAELQRRHVVRAAIAHIVVAWLLIQFADVVLPYIGIVDEAVRWAFVISVATFPITIIIAWLFEHPWHKFTGSRLAFDVIVIVAVGALAATWAVRNIPDVVRIKTSIAVLPFAHSGDSLEQSVSRAIAYEVNSLLMKSKSIDVIGFESVTSPVLAGLGTMAVAERLRVQHVLSGEVSVLDNLMRIDLRLLDSAGAALWEAVIEDSIDNLFSVQERIAVAIESRLGAGDNTVPVTTVAANRCWMPNDPAALEMYYTARYYIELRTDTELSCAGAALWEAVIEDSIDNLFSVQERIAVAIESRLGAGDNTVPVTTVAANRCWMPNDPAALEMYYTARYYIELRTDTELSWAQIQDAIRLYRELVDEYPKFADALSGLAWAVLHQLSYDPENAMPREEAEELAAQLAEQALALCPTLGEAMHLIPNQYDHENDWIGAHQQLTAFLEMQPDRTEYYQRLARHYRETGLLDRAGEIAEKNYALNPLSVKAIKILAAHYQQVGRVEEAIELFDLSIELGNTGPNFARETAAMLACDKVDVDCLFASFPPMFGSFKDSFRVIYREPANAAEAQESIDAALAVFHASNGFLVNILNFSACDREHLTPLFFNVWDASTELWKVNGYGDPYWYWPNTWNENCTRVWADPRFPAFAEEVDYVEYWQEVGFPPGFGMTEDGESLRYIEP